MMKSTRVFGLCLVLLLGAAIPRALGTGCQLTDEPVCGADGIEYTNECIANAQSIEIASFGRCPPLVIEIGTPAEGSTEVSSEESSEETSEEPEVIIDPGVYISRALRETEGFVKFDEITAEAEIGYTFVGVYNFKAGSVPPQSLPVAEYTDLELEAEEEAASEGGMLASENMQLEQARDDRRGRRDRLRGASLNRNGRHRAQSRNRQRRSLFRRTPARRPGSGRRSLLQDAGIINGENRTLAPIDVPGKAFPYTAVVRLVYTFEGRRLTTCTAAFIDSNVLLTSASCLYDLESQSFYDFRLIKVWDGFGNRLDTEVETVVVTTNYILGETANDIALVLLDSSTSFIDSLGAFGYGQTCERVPFSGAGLLTGYPLSKGGEEVWKSRCALQYDCDSVLIKHQCDLTVGESGAPIVSGSDNILRAVGLGLVRGDSEYNSAVLLDEDLVDWIDEIVDDLKTKNL